VSVADQYGPVETTQRRPGVFTEWAGGSPVSTRAVSARRIEAHRDTPAVVPSPLAICGVLYSSCGL
jgi:hypothetical protein